MSKKTVKKERKPSLSKEEKARKDQLRKEIMGRFNDVTSMATLLADKKFYEYSGLLFKEAAGDFKHFAEDIAEVAKKIAEIRSEAKKLQKENGKIINIPKKENLWSPNENWIKNSFETSENRKIFVTSSICVI